MASGCFPPHSCRRISSHDLQLVPAASSTRPGAPGPSRDLRSDVPSPDLPSPGIPISPDANQVEKHHERRTRRQARGTAQRAWPGVTGVGFPWSTPLTSPTQTQQEPPLAAPDSTLGLGRICTTHHHHDTPVMTALAQILESAWFCGLELPLRVTQSFDHLQPGALMTPRGRCSLLSLTGPLDRAGAVSLRLDSKADARGWRKGLSALPALPEQSGAGNTSCPWRPGQGRGCSLLPSVRSACKHSQDRQLFLHGPLTPHLQSTRSNASVHHDNTEATASLPDTLRQDANCLPFHRPG